MNMEKKAGKQARNLGTCLYGQSGVLTNHVDNMALGQLFVLKWQSSEFLLCGTRLLETLSARQLYTIIFVVSSVVPWAMLRKYLEKEATTSFQTRSDSSFFSHSVIRRFTDFETDVVRRNSLSSGCK
jgi:hypothetical protein